MNNAQQRELLEDEYVTHETLIARHEANTLPKNYKIVVDYDAWGANWPHLLIWPADDSDYDADNVTEFNTVEDYLDWCDVE